MIAAAAVLYLFTLEINNGVLAPVLKDVLEGGDLLLGHQLGKLDVASSVQKISQEL